MSKPALYHLPLESDAVEVLPLAGGLLPGRELLILHVRNHGFCKQCATTEICGCATTGSTAAAAAGWPSPNARLSSMICARDLLNFDLSPAPSRCLLSSSSTASPAARTERGARGRL